MKIPVLIAFATDLKVGRSSFFLTTCSVFAKVDANHFLTSSGTFSLSSSDKSSPSVSSFRATIVRASATDSRSVRRLSTSRWWEVRRPAMMACTLKTKSSKMYIMNSLGLTNNGSAGISSKIVCKYFAEEAAGLTWCLPPCRPAGCPHGVCRAPHVLPGGREGALGNVNTLRSNYWAGQLHFSFLIKNCKI